MIITGIKCLIKVIGMKIRRGRCDHTRVEKIEAGRLRCLDCGRYFTIGGRL